MAGLFTILRRRRNLVCKLIIVVPILWFALIGVTVVFTEDNNSLGSRQIFANVGKARDSNIERRIDDNNNNIDKNHNNDDIKNPNQIVIERPASGRLKGDAGEESDPNKKPVLVEPIKDREKTGSTTTIDPNAPGQSYSAVACLSLLHCWCPAHNEWFFVVIGVKIRSHALIFGPIKNRTFATDNLSAIKTCRCALSSDR